MSAHAIRVLVVIALMSMMVIVVALVMLSIDARNRKIGARLTALGKTYAPVTPKTAVEKPHAMSRFFGAEGFLIAALRRIAPFYYERPDIYPLPWWVVFVIAAGLALLFADLGTKLVGPFGWLAAPILWVIISRWAFRRWHEKRARLLYTQLPDALSMIVRGVRAGLPVTEAFRVVAREAPLPTAHEFALLHGEVSIGLQLTEAIWNMAARTGLNEYRIFAVALSLQGQTGGNLTETLENIADVIRKRLAVRARGLALSSEARTTSMVLAALPFVAGGALTFIQPDYIALLFTDERGNMILAAGIFFLALGIYSMQTIIKRTLSLG